jgi:hypothetical protein
MTVQLKTSVIEKLENFLRAYDDAGPQFDNPENPEDCTRPAVSYPLGSLPRHLVAEAIQELRAR